MKRAKRILWAARRCYSPFVPIGYIKNRPKAFPWLASGEIGSISSVRFVVSPNFLSVE